MLRRLLLILQLSSAHAVLLGCGPGGDPAMTEMPNCFDAAGFGASSTLCTNDRDCAGGTCIEANAEEGTCGRCVTFECTMDAQCDAPRAQCDVARGVCVADSCADRTCDAAATCVSTVDGAVCEQIEAPTRCALSPARGLWVSSVRARLDVIAEGPDGVAVALPSESVQITIEASGTGAGVEDVTAASATLSEIDLVPACAADRCAATVRVDVGAVRCEASMIMLPEVEADTVRVAVVSAEDEGPLTDASVEIRFADGSLLELVSDADGVAQTGTLSAGSAVQSVTARASGRGAVTLLATTGRDLVLPLPRVQPLDLIAGATGTIDATHVVAPADVVVGAAGLPFGDLEDALRADRLFGRPRVSFLDLGNPEPQPFVSFTGGTLAVGTQETVTHFAVESEPGRRFAWAFVGAVRLGALGGMLGELPERGPLFPAIELIRAVDERATFGVSRAVTSTWVVRPEQNADYVDAGLADVGAVVPDVFTSERIEVVVPPLPVAHRGALLLALADTAVGAVPIGARYLEDSDGDGLFDDDLRPIASGHELFVAPPARALAGRPIIFAVLAIDRAQLEEGVLGDTRVFSSVPALPPAGVPFVVAEAFPVAPQLTLDDARVLSAQGVQGELIITLDGENAHTIVFSADGEADLLQLDPVLANGAVLRARASIVSPDWRLGARGARERARRVSATTRVVVRAP